MPINTAGSLVRQRALGALLGKARTDRNLTLREVVSAVAPVKLSQSRLSRIENGESAVRSEALDALVEVYEITEPDRAALYQLLPEATGRRSTAWFHAYSQILDADTFGRIALEHEAVEVVEYLPLDISGLLQTPAYAAATQRGGYYTLGEEQVQDHTQIRMRRQERLTGDNPLRVVVYVTEAATHITRGSTGEVLREQIERLIRAADEASISIRIVPNNAGPSAVYSSGLTLLRFPDGAPSIVFLDVVGASLMRDTAKDIERAERSFRHLDEEALSETESVAFLARRAKEIK